jgi:hypothetical protein
MRNFSVFRVNEKGGGYSLTHIGVIMELRVGVWCVVLPNGKELQPFMVGVRIGVEHGGIQ